MTTAELDLLRDVGNDRIRLHDEKLWRRLDGDRTEPFHSWADFNALQHLGLVVIDHRRGAVALTRAGYLALSQNASLLGRGVRSVGESTSPLIP